MTWKCPRCHTVNDPHVVSCQGGCGTWKCSRCGNLNDPQVIPCQAGCGNCNYGQLVLTAVSGQEVRMNIDTAVNRSMLARLVGDEARFASEPQYLLLRSEHHESWAVKPAAKAVNATYVNGLKLEDGGVAISDGSEITIGIDKARVKVRVQF